MPAAWRIRSGHRPGAGAERECCAPLGQRGGTKRDPHCDTQRRLGRRGRWCAKLCARAAAIELYRWHDPDQGEATRRHGDGGVASRGSARVCVVVARADEVIRIDAAWFAVEPLDMRAGVDTALARVVSVFGEARAHHAYLFINKRANRMKVLVHDGFGLWLCARKLYEGSFIRAGVRHDRGMPLSHEQLQAIVVGLPWERLDERAKIHVL